MKRRLGTTSVPSGLTVRNVGARCACGTKSKPDELGIAAGSIDGSSVKGVLPKLVDHHIFVKERGRLVPALVEDGLPKYEGVPPGFQPDASPLGQTGEV